MAPPMQSVTRMSSVDERFTTCLNRTFLIICTCLFTASFIASFSAYGTLPELGTLLVYAGAGSLSVAIMCLLATLRHFNLISGTCMRRTPRRCVETMAEACRRLYRSSNSPERTPPPLSRQDSGGYSPLPQNDTPVSPERQTVTGSPIDIEDGNHGSPMVPRRPAHTLSDNSFHDDQQAATGHGPAYPAPMRRYLELESDSPPHEPPPLPPRTGTYNKRGTKGKINRLPSFVIEPETHDASSQRGASENTDQQHVSGATSHKSILKSHERKHIGGGRPKTAYDGGADMEKHVTFERTDEPAAATGRETVPPCIKHTRGTQLPDATVHIHLPPPNKNSGSGSVSFSRASAALSGGQLMDMSTVLQQQNPPVSQQLSPRVSQQLSPRVSQQSSPRVCQQPNPQVSQQLSPLVLQRLHELVSQEPSPQILQQIRELVSQLPNPQVPQQLRPPVSNPQLPTQALPGNQMSNRSRVFQELSLKDSKQQPLQLTTQFEPPVRGSQFSKPSQNPKSIPSVHPNQIRPKRREQQVIMEEPKGNTDDPNFNIPPSCPSNRFMSGGQMTEVKSPQQHTTKAKLKQTDVPQQPSQSPATHTSSTTETPKLDVEAQGNVAVQRPDVSIDMPTDSHLSGGQVAETRVPVVVKQSPIPKPGVHGKADSTTPKIKQSKVLEYLSKKQETNKGRSTVEPQGVRQKTPPKQSLPNQGAPQQAVSQSVEKASEKESAPQQTQPQQALQQLEHGQQQTVQSLAEQQQVQHTTPEPEQQLSGPQQSGQGEAASPLTGQQGEQQRTPAGSQPEVAQDQYATHSFAGSHCPLVEQTSHGPRQIWISNSGTVSFESDQSPLQQIPSQSSASSVTTHQTTDTSERARGSDPPTSSSEISNDEYVNPKSWQGQRLMDSKESSEISGQDQEMSELQRDAPRDERPTGSRDETPTGSRDEMPTGSRYETLTGSRDETPTGSRYETLTGLRDETPTGSRDETLTGSRDETPTGSRDETPTGSRDETPIGSIDNPVYISIEALSNPQASQSQQQDAENEPATRIDKTQLSIALRSAWSGGHMQEVRPQLDQQAASYSFGDLDGYVPFGFLSDLPLVHQSARVQANVDPGQTPPEDINLGSVQNEDCPEEDIHRLFDDNSASTDSEKELNATNDSVKSQTASNDPEKESAVAGDSENESAAPVDPEKAAAVEEKESDSDNEAVDSEKAPLSSSDSTKGPSAPTDPKKSWLASCSSAASSFDSGKGSSASIDSQKSSCADSRVSSLASSASDKSSAASSDSEKEPVATGTSAKESASGNDSGKSSASSSDSEKDSSRQEHSEQKGGGT